MKYLTVLRGVSGGEPAKLDLKPGGLEAIKKSGPRPCVKMPFGVEDQYSDKLTEMYKDLIPIDGKDLLTASQVMPVMDNIDGNRKVRRLAVNYKSTINQHLEDVPDISPRARKS